MRFYGIRPMMWYNQSADGFSLNGFVPTNIGGGDPGIVKLSNGNYIMVYVGPNLVTATSNPVIDTPLKIFPNPFTSAVTLHGKHGKQYAYSLLTAAGSLLRKGMVYGSSSLNLAALPAGTYLLVMEDDKKMYCSKLVKK